MISTSVSRFRFQLRATSAALALSLAASLVPAGVALAQDKPATDTPATDAPVPDKQDWGAFGVQTQWMDTKVLPGDDFDKYANGKWNDTVKIPADKARIGAFISLSDLSEQRLKGILETIVASDHPAGSDEARIAASYKAFMDKAAIDAAGLAPARPYLDRIFAAQSSKDIATLFGSPGFASPIDISIDADEKQSDVYALYLSQGGLGLPDRDYYLSGDKDYVEKRVKYRAYLEFLLGKLGYADAKAAADSVYSLEVRMAQEMWDRNVERDRDLIYNKLDGEQIAAMDPDGALRTLLAADGITDPKSAVVDEMPPTEAELKTAGISPADAAAKIGGGVPATIGLIDKVPLATWKAWLAVHFLIDHSSVMPSDIYDATFAFFGTEMAGQPQPRARWKRGIDAVEDQVGDLLGKAYAKLYYPPAEKAAMEELVGNLRKSMAISLGQLKWMGPQTREEALKKLDEFDPKIGAPTKYKTYDGLVLSPDTPLANQIASEKWQADFSTGRLGKPVDRTEWMMFPQTVNAYYYATFNEIVFPAAILQPPFFNIDADPAVNYGGIGAVIGHEMGHGFDDQGSKSDGKGNLRDWWTAQDKANFEKIQKKLVAQYSSYCPFDDGKTCVDGKLTLGENIGDLGGLSVAYRAYKLSLGGKPAPVIDGFTGDQRFFLSWAQVWRSKAREKLARQYLVTDPHAPAHYRINGIVRNFDEWYKAFDVKPGEALYLPPDQRVRTW